MEIIYLKSIYYSVANKDFRFSSLQMDEESSVVQNDDDDTIESRNDDHEMNNSGVQDAIREGDNSMEQRNVDDDTSEEANENHALEPDFDDQPMPIFLEGAPNFPPIPPRLLIHEDHNEGDNNADDEQNDGNYAQRVAVFLGNRDNIDGDDSNSDENESDLENESLIAVSSSSNEDSENEDGDAEERETFDTELPGQHQYMGESREVGGRIILEENNYVDIPVISQPGIILMPGQTLPMTFFQPQVISMMKGLVETTKTFGILHKR